MYKKKQFKRNPWSNDLLIKFSKYKEKLYSLKKTNPNNSYIKSMFSVYTKKVNNLSAYLKKQYYDNLFMDSVNNLKNTWTLVNNIV